MFNVMLPQGRTRAFTRRISVFVLTSSVLAACSAPGYRVHRHAGYQVEMPSTEVVFYPAHGQAPAQQERDRYECYVWSVQRTGFDPNKFLADIPQHVEVTPASPAGSDVVAGAVGGAIVGSILSPRHDRRAGTVVGAITGAFMGAESDAAKQEQAQRLQQDFNQNEQQSYAQLDKQARNFRRAMAACLEGRGYTVRE